MHDILKKILSIATILIIYFSMIFMFLFTLIVILPISMIYKIFTNKNDLKNNNNEIEIEIIKENNKD